MKRKLTLKERVIYNLAIEDCARHVAKFDGLIPASRDREYLVESIRKKKYINDKF